MIERRKCYHCHEPVPRGFDLSVVIDDQPRAMCCHGCAAVAGMLSGNQLEQFYQLRDAAAARPDVKELDWWRAFDDPVLLGQLADRDGPHYRLAVNVNNLRCAACVWLLESCLRRLPGVAHLVVNYATGQGELSWDPARIALSTILIEADKLGYPLQPALLASQGKQRQQKRASLRRLLVAALGMFQVMMMSVGLYLGVGADMQLAERDFLRWIALLLATPVVLYSGWPFIQTAWRQLLRLRPGMDVPVSLAILLAWGSSCVNTFAGAGEVYFDSAVMFVFFLSVSRHLELTARLRSRAVSDHASQALPLVVKRETDAGAAETIQAMHLKTGDIILSTAGETLAADGELLGEQSISVNESLLTGESHAVTKQPGDTLLAGSQIIDGAPRLRVTACGRQTVLAGIQQLMHKTGSEDHGPDWSHRLAVWFTTALLALATLTAIWHSASGWQHSLQVTLAVLVVSCPCALALAMPSVLASARARLARRGVLLRDAGVLLRVPAITRVIADKTGTLTRGEFSLKQVIALGQQDQNTLTALAAAMAEHSSHPLSRALQSIKTDVIASGIEEQSGHGLEASVGGQRYRLGKLDYVAGLSSADTQLPRTRTGDSSDSELWLGNTRGVLGVLRLGDQPKPEAGEILHALAQPVTVLSGDQPAAVASLADKLGLDDAHGGLLPAGKLERLQAYQRAGDQVLAIGDGINDAPLLAAADIGIAIGTRHSLAKVAADVLVLHDDLRALPLLLQCAQLARQRIRQNLTWALAYNVSVIPIAMLGWLPPWLAALGMSLSSLLVVGNSLRFGGLQKDMKQPAGTKSERVASALHKKPVTA